MKWSQQGDRLTLRLQENRTCTSVRHVPVVRIERVDRKTAGGAMWFEYGLGAGALALGLSGLIAPERFSQGSVTIDGEEMQDTSAGYRIGGIFTALGVVLLTAAVVDTVRTRDEVVYTDAYRRDVGGTVTCRDPLVPLRSQTVELLVDEWSTSEPTDDEGSVRLLLPPPQELPPAARERIEAISKWDADRDELMAKAEAAAEEARLEAEQEAAKSKRRRKKKKAEPEPEPVVEPPPDPAATLGPRPEPLTVKAVLRIDQARVMPLDFVVPYGSEAASGHQGQDVVEPLPTVDGPVRSKRKKAGEGQDASGEPASSEPTAAPTGGSLSLGAREATKTEPTPP